MIDEKVNYIIDIIKDMDLENQLRLAICMCDNCSYTNLEYDKKEIYKHFDNKFREIDEEYRTTLINFAQTKYFNINFTMAKLIEVTSRYSYLI